MLVGHGLKADRFEGFGDVLFHCAWRREIAALDFAQLFADIGVVAIEWGLTGKKVVERCAEAIHISSRTQFIEPAGSLFGAHVGGGADRGARQRWGGA